MITQAQRDEWCRRLRSGDYKQGRDCLRTIKDRYCCLGVLCDVIDTTKWSKHNFAEKYMFDGEIALLPDESILDADTQCQLTHFNDVDQWNFDGIADWIEQNITVSGANP